MKKENFRICTDGTKYWLERKVLFCWWNVDFSSSIVEPSRFDLTKYFDSEEIAEAWLDRMLDFYNRQKPKSKVVKVFSK